MKLVEELEDGEYVYNSYCQKYIIVSPDFSIYDEYSVYEPRYDFYDIKTTKFVKSVTSSSWDNSDFSIESYKLIGKIGKTHEVKNNQITILAKYDWAEGDVFEINNKLVFISCIKKLYTQNSVTILTEDLELFANYNIGSNINLRDYISSKYDISYKGMIGERYKIK